MKSSATSAESDVNRVLSLPDIAPRLLQVLMASRHDTVVTAAGTVRIRHSQGSVEMRFSAAEAPMVAGVRVYVWWKGGGFVCAPADDVDAQALATQRVAERVAQARAALAKARQDRTSRFGELHSEPGALPPADDTIAIY